MRDAVGACGGERYEGLSIRRTDWDTLLRTDVDGASAGRRTKERREIKDQELQCTSIPALFFS